MMTSILLIIISIVARGAATGDIVSPELKHRLERVLELSDLPTARMVLRLLVRDPHHQEPQVVKRLLKGINAFQQQVLSLTNQFLQTEVSDATPVSLVDTVLFLAQDDPSLFQWYMTRKERARLNKAVSRYRALSWPENQAALENCVQLLRAAKALRDMIVRLHQGVEEAADAARTGSTATGSPREPLASGATRLDMSQPETREMARVALRRMKTLCKQRVALHRGDNDNEASAVFTEEVDDYLSTLDALLVDRSDQDDQLAIVMALWQNVCLGAITTNSAST